MILTPRIVGRAESAHAPVLAAILARVGMTRLQWVTLAVAPRPDLVTFVARTQNVSPDAAGAAVAELAGAGLLDAGTPTAAGRTRHAQVQAEIDAVVGRAYAGIPPGDLATAARVLVRITERLEAESSAR